MSRVCQCFLEERLSSQSSAYNVDAVSLNDMNCTFELHQVDTYTIDIIGRRPTHFKYC